MREILFRAKSCIGSWVYGYPKKQMVGDKADVWAIQTEIPESEKPMFIPQTSKQNAHTTRLYENVVDPDTVGEWTGLFDKNGVKVFEGDIVNDETDTGVITWCHSHLWGVKIISGADSTLGMTYPLWQWDNCAMNGYKRLTVISNIHDNPELLNV